MASLLIDIEPGDEVIIPSYTFVSTANPFLLRGAKVIFADSSIDNPNIDASKLEALITSKTKAIVVVHYGGVACDMDRIMKIAADYNLYVIEDAAQAIDSYYKGKPLGGIGHFGTFSFHQTKNITCGEGGMLVINDEKFINRAEILWEKGTNRVAFNKGNLKEYGWMDIGSSFLPSEIIAAYLWSQLEKLEEIQNKRKQLWNNYYKTLRSKTDLPKMPIYSTNNANMFYLICRSKTQRNKLIYSLKEKGIVSAFHYLPLHKSEYYHAKHDGRDLLNSIRYSECILRLPIYESLSLSNQQKIIDEFVIFFKNEPSR